MEFNQKIIEVFNILDKEDKKTIPVRDLAKGLRASGLNPTESQLSQYKSEAVLIEHDRLDLTEFEKIASKCKESNAITKEEVLNYFMSFSTNNQEYLGLAELTAALCASGDKLESKDVETLMRDFDKQNEGKVYIKEFVDGLFNS